MTPLDEFLAAIGPRWHLDIRAQSQAVKNTYEPLLERSPKTGIESVRDLAYGAHPRQRLDLFVPQGASRAPVVVFVHGGAFVRGDKRTNAQIYDNVAIWFARHGCVGANIEYRLAPEAPYPAGAEDVRAALDWLHANVAAHGGDPARMLLIGHSAGGTHAASHVFDPGLNGGSVRPVGLVLISARLRADRLAENPNADGVAAYFGADAALDDARSPMAHAAGSHLPVFIVVAEFENPLLDVYGLEFAHRIALARRRAPRFLQVRKHNHMSIVAQFNSGDDTLGSEILEFFDSVVPPS